VSRQLRCRAAAQSWTDALPAVALYAGPALWKDDVGQASHGEEHGEEGVEEHRDCNTRKHTQKVKQAAVDPESPATAAQQERRGGHADYAHTKDADAGRTAGQRIRAAQQRLTCEPARRKQVAQAGAEGLQHGRAGSSGMTAGCRGSQQLHQQLVPAATQESLPEQPASSSLSNQAHAPQPTNRRHLHPHQPTSAPLWCKQTRRRGPGGLRAAPGWGP
jgi:hypothetical protein